MNKTRVFLASLAFTALLSGALLSGVATAAPALDSAGKCRDNGKFVDAKLCQTAAPTTARCRNIQTKKFAKCGTPGTEPVPASASASGSSSSSASSAKSATGAK
jgi:hypothetical protein